MSAGTLALSEQGLLLVDPEDGAQSNGADELAASPRAPSTTRKTVFAAVIFSLVGAAGFLYHRYSSRTHSTAAGKDGLVERYAQVGSQPWCPSGLQMEVGCLEKGHLDNDCCAFSGDGGCRDGSAVTEGAFCHANGAVATCCPPQAGPPALTSAARNPRYWPAGTGAAADPQVYPSTTSAAVDPQDYATATGAVADPQVYPSTTSAAVDPQDYATATGSAADPQVVYATPTGAAADPQVYPAGTGAAADAQYYYPAGTSATVIQAPAPAPVTPAPAPPAPAPPPPPAQIGGFYCWVVSANWGYEADLTKDAFAKKRCVFACDEWSVLSNDPMPPVPTTKIGALNSKPASWGSYLNTEVFIRAWNSVLEQDKWSRHAWTIKADPDTVWFPQRLHGYVDKLDAHSAIFLRNSGDCYLGPLEVFSFGAVQKFAAQHSQLCGGNIGVSGEDGWIEGCMKNVGASEQENGNLLVSSTDVGACGNGAMVAFHPFKNVGSFNACFGRATR